MQLPGQTAADKGWMCADGSPVPDDRWKDDHPSDVAGVYGSYDFYRWNYAIGSDVAENGDRDCAVFAGHGSLNYRSAPCNLQYETICQSVECGSLGLSCCGQGSCEYGLECSGGECVAGCA